MLTKKQKEIEKYIHIWEEEGISVQKARRGRFNIIKGKIKIELPKTTDAQALTLEEVEAIIEAKAPKKNNPSIQEAKQIRFIRNALRFSLVSSSSRSSTDPIHLKQKSAFLRIEGMLWIAAKASSLSS